MHNREQQILRTPLKDGNSVYEQEFIKGEAAGLGLVLALPNTLIETAKAAVEAEEAKASQPTAQEN